MKRKRGDKKGKQLKARPASTCTSTTATSHSPAEDDEELVVNLDNSDEDEDNKIDGVGGVSPIEVGPPSNPSVSSEKAELGKKLSLVKVKLKTPKPPSATALESPIKPNNNTIDKIKNYDDNNNNNNSNKDGNRKDEKVVSEDTRLGSIKIKTYTSSRSKLSSFKDKEKSNVAGGGGGKEEPKTPLPLRKPRYDKQELDSALMIINKVMNMEAAEPFNDPVNPEALGIPDYFDIIDTPMDFGTICSNLEKGDKYMNSEDVYKDVQYIWDNCYKYNSKGDYILDLMRRVKKNFMKYWMAAGLYTEQTRGSDGAEGVPGEDVATSSLSNAKAKKTKKRRRHKNDCLCAICVLKRRRREREEKERLARGQAGVIDDKIAQESKQEESSLMESPDGEDSSSNMGESEDPDADVEVEGKAQVEKVEAERQSSPLEDKREEELEGVNVDEEEEEENETETQREEKVETSEQSQFAEKLGEESSQKLQHGIANDEGAKIQTQTEKAHVLVQKEEERVPDQPIKHKLQESLDRAQRAKVFEHFHAENSMLLGLCKSLFPRNRKSVWSGPRSLVPHQGSSRRSSIQEAIETLMK